MHPSKRRNVGLDELELQEQSTAVDKLDQAKSELKEKVETHWTEEMQAQFRSCADLTAALERLLMQSNVQKSAIACERSTRFLRDSVSTALQKLDNENSSSHDWQRAETRCAVRHLFFNKGIDIDALLACHSTRLRDQTTTCTCHSSTNIEFFDSKIVLRNENVHLTIELLNSVRLTDRQADEKVLAEREAKLEHDVRCSEALWGQLPTELVTGADRDWFLRLRSIASQLTHLCDTIEKNNNISL